jgi:hypothetical protein
MLHLHHRVVVDVHHLGEMHLVHHPVHLDLNFYMDHYSLVHQLMNQFVVESLNHLQVDAHLADVQQNLDEQILDEHLTFLVADHFREHPLVAVVDVELHHQLRMDYFLHVVDVELRHQLKMDYFLDAQSALQELHLVVQVQPAAEFVALQFVQGAPLFLLAQL